MLNLIYSFGRSCFFQALGFGILFCVWLIHFHQWLSIVYSFCLLNIYLSSCRRWTYHSLSHFGCARTVGPVILCGLIQNWFDLHFQTSAWTQFWISIDFRQNESPPAETNEISSCSYRALFQLSLPISVLASTDFCGRKCPCFLLRYSLIKCSWDPWVQIKYNYNI